MKKGILFFLILVSQTPLFALPVGNPIDASLLRQGVIWEGCPCTDLCLNSARVGIYGDYVFNRYLEVAGGDHARIANTTLYTNAGLLVLNFWDRVDLFATLGQSKMRIDTDLSPFTVFPSLIRAQFTVQGASHFSWSLGGRATLWECNSIGIGIEGQYFSTHPFIRRLTLNELSIYPDALTMYYHEWQLGVGITYRISVFAPYLAVKCSRSMVSFNETVFFPFDLVMLQKMRNRKLWGFAIGSSFIECDRVSLSVEGRFGDEKALSLNGQLRF